MPKKNIWGIIKNLSFKGKMGFLLWIMGYPTGFIGIVLLSTGNHFLGSFLFVLPIFEGNLGIFLIGKEIFEEIKKELK